MPLISSPIATIIVKMEKICCIPVPLILVSRSFPRSKPARTPKANGAAIVRFKLPVKADNKAPPVDMMARTPNEVATTDFIGKLVYFLRAGTMIKPPPTPNKPDKNPAKAPAITRDLAQGTVQINFPIDGSSKHGGGGGFFVG